MVHWAVFGVMKVAVGIEQDSRLMCDSYLSSLLHQTPLMNVIFRLPPATRPLPHLLTACRAAPNVSGGGSPSLRRSR